MCCCRYASTDPTERTAPCLLHVCSYPELQQSVHIAAAVQALRPRPRIPPPECSRVQVEPESRHQDNPAIRSAPEGGRWEVLLLPGAIVLRALGPAMYGTDPARARERNEEGQAREPARYRASRGEGSAGSGRADGAFVWAGVLLLLPTVAWSTEADTICHLAQHSPRLMPSLPCIALDWCVIDRSSLALGWYHVAHSFCSLPSTDERVWRYQVQLGLLKFTAYDSEDVRNISQVLSAYDRPTNVAVVLRVCCPDRERVLCYQLLADMEYFRCASEELHFDHCRLHFWAAQHPSAPRARAILAEFQVQSAALLCEARNQPRRYIVTWSVISWCAMASTAELEGLT
eukprot:3396261-Rhodomonas_salina.1